MPRTAAGREAPADMAVAPPAAPRGLTAPDAATSVPAHGLARRRLWRIAGWLAALGLIGATLAAWRQPGLVLDLFGQIYSCM